MRRVDDTELSHGHHRKLPEDLDWLKRYLGYSVGDGVSFEQVKLEAANLEQDAWKAMKNAYRQHLYRRARGSGGLSQGTYEATRVLGPLWKRVIALGLVTEKEARNLAEGEGEFTYYSDAGCRYLFGVVMGRAARKTESGGDMKELVREMSKIVRTLVLEDIDPTLENIVTQAVKVYGRGEAEPGTAGWNGAGEWANRKMVRSVYDSLQIE